MEKCAFVDQKVELRFHKISELVLSHPDAFLRQGSVVSSWRVYRGRRLGPFFSLRYRIEGQQSSIYLGRSLILAEQVRGLLMDLQQERRLTRLKRQARAELHKCKASWQQELASMGLSLKGFEVRGWSGLQKTDAPSEIGGAGKKNHG